jgi:hypothetical protein
VTGTPIHYDPETHTYTKTDEQGSPLEISGVTSLLESAGLISQFYKNEQARVFGQIGHDTMRLLLRDELGEYDPAFEPWMEGMQAFIQDCQPGEIVALDDTIVHSEKYGYAGRPDYIGQAFIRKMGRGRGLYDLDWKFWANATEAQLDNAELQLEAYSKAALEMELITTVPKNAVVHFLPGEYQIHPLNDPAAWTVFVSCLNIRRWKERH